MDSRGVEGEGSEPTVLKLPSLPVLSGWSNGVRPDAVERSANSPAAGGALAVLPLSNRDFIPDGGFCYRVDLPDRFFGPLAPGEVLGSVLENQQILGPDQTPHPRIRQRGGGCYSIWHDAQAKVVRLYFSSSDNSDPRRNGRSYHVFNQPLNFVHDWDYFDRRRWLNHSRARYFLRRGGEKVPPPLCANLGITNICNLRCGICGSQNIPHAVNRRHMDIRVFQQVAETLFPLLMVVEFNSRGEPLLHPQTETLLETVLDYGLFFRLQTNGTQLTDRKLRLLARMTGELSLSIDATGELFEYARTYAKWEQVDRGVRDLLAKRDRDRLAVYLYPTLTAKTAAGAPALIDWAKQVGVDRIDFHQYDPIQNGVEERPSAAALDEIRRYADQIDSQHPLQIRLDYEIIRHGAPPDPTPQQLRYFNLPRPAGSSGAHPLLTCAAPAQLVDIDLDGGVSVCCMMQERKLGNALTPEAFADCWFGAEYQAVRASLQRGHDPLYETCRNCIRLHQAA